MDKSENSEMILLDKFPECMEGYTFDFCNTKRNFSFGLEDFYYSDSVELENGKCTPPLFIISDDSDNELENIPPTTDKEEYNLVDLDMSDFDPKTIEQIENIKPVDVSTPKKARFSHISNNSEIHERMINNVPQKTRYQNHWAISVWETWSECRNAQYDDGLIPKNDEPYKKVPTKIQGIDERELGFWLKYFVLEVKRKDGKDYPPNTIYEICCALQRHYNDRSQGKFKSAEIFNCKDERCYKFYECLDSQMRELTQAGLGTIVKRADPILDEEEDKLWESEIISTKTAQGLLYGIYYYNLKCFGLRGGQIHRDLKASQHSIKYNVDAKVDVLYYHERLDKNALAGLRHRKVMPRTGEVLAQPENERCVVNLFRTYLSKIRRMGRCITMRVNRKKIRTN